MEGEEGNDEGGDRQLSRHRTTDLTTPRPDEMASDGVANRGERYVRTPSTDDMSM
jgi:hypothetical protein